MPDCVYMLVRETNLYRLTFNKPLSLPSISVSTITEALAGLKDFIIATRPYAMSKKMGLLSQFHNTFIEMS